MTQATQSQNERIKQHAAPDRARPESDARESAKSAKIKAALEKIAAFDADLGEHFKKPENRALIEGLYASENEEEPQPKKMVAGEALRRGFYEVGRYAGGFATIALLGYLILVGTSEIKWMDEYREYLQHLQSVGLWWLVASVIACNVAMVFSKNAYWIIYQIPWLMGNLVLSGSLIGLLCHFWEQGSPPNAQSIGSIISTAFTVTAIGGVLWVNALVFCWIEDNNYQPEYGGNDKTEGVSAPVRRMPPSNDFLD